LSWGTSIVRGCIPHFAGSFTTLSAEGDVRPDVYVGWVLFRLLHSALLHSPTTRIVRSFASESLLTLDFHPGTSLCHQATHNKEQIVAKTPGVSKSQAVRNYLKTHGKAANKEVSEALAKQGIKVSPNHVANITDH
jgi:hypothetical protein